MRAARRVAKFLAIYVGVAGYARYSGLSWLWSLLIPPLALAVIGTAAAVTLLREVARTRVARNRDLIARGYVRAVEVGGGWLRVRYANPRWWPMARWPWRWPWARVRKVEVYAGDGEAPT